MGTTGDIPLPDKVRLRLLATSDVHAHLLAWDYYADRAAPDRGLARIATLVARMRRGADLSILVDNGDFLQGSPLGDAAALGAARLDGGATHPIIAAMNAMGYDAAALGNHEFSHGMAILMQAAAEARFPILSANILTDLGATPDQDRTLLPASTMIRRQVAGQSLTIGLIGLTPTMTLAWEARHLDRPLHSRPMAEAAEAQARDLRRRGADLVVALCHAGLDLGEEAAGVDTDAGRIAALPGIDAVVAGHTHRLFPDPALPPGPGIDPARGRVRGKPVVAPGFFGSHLGVIDLVLSRRPEGWAIAGRRARLLPVAERNSQGRLSALVAEDPALRALALPAHDATRVWASQTIGANPARVTTHFALVAPSEAVRVVARAQAQAVRAALKGTVHAGLPILASASPYRAGGRGGPGNYTLLPRGPLTLRNLVDLYPFPNTLAALRLTGAEVAAWLEHSAAVYRQIAPGAQDAELIDPAFPFFNFETIEGLTWSFDVSRPALFDAAGAPTGAAGGGRVRDLALDGQPLAPDRPVILATNNYRLSGAGGFIAGLQGRIVLDGTEASRDVLQRYIADMGQLPPAPPPNWTLTRQPGTTVVIDTGPAAVEMLPGLAQFRPEPMTICADGFQRFRLHLD